MKVCAAENLKSPSTDDATVLQHLLPFCLLLRKKYSCSFSWLFEVTEEASEDKHGLDKDIPSKHRNQEEKQQDHLLYDEQIQHL